MAGPALQRDPTLIGIARNVIRAGNARFMPAHVIQTRLDDVRGDVKPIRQAGCKHATQVVNFPRPIDSHSEIEPPLLRTEAANPPVVAPREDQIAPVRWNTGQNLAGKRRQVENVLAAVFGSLRRNFPDRNHSGTRNGVHRRSRATDSR